jgi:hypothetical protein
VSIADLKTHLHDVPGIETLSIQMPAGRQNYSIAGRLVSLDAGGICFCRLIGDGFRAGASAMETAQPLDASWRRRFRRILRESGH